MFQIKHLAGPYNNIYLLQPNKFNGFVFKIQQNKLQLFLKNYKMNNFFKEFKFKMGSIALLLGTDNSKTGGCFFIYLFSKM